MSIVRTAVYLIDQGPYREPRPLELQYLRILRYKAALETKLDCYFEIGSQYVDVNFHRSFDGSDLPELERLVSALKSKEFEAVLLDVREGEGFDSHGYTPVIWRLRRTGAKIYNCYYDDEAAMADELVRHWGDIGRDHLPQGYADDFIAFFPALAASIVYEVLGEDRREPAAGTVGLQKTVQSLANENPYNRSALPLFWHRRRHELRVILEQKQLERRKTDLLYVLGPESHGLLVDEHVWEHSRNEAELVRAQERLCSVLGFEKRLDGQLLSYTHEVEGYTVYADPRAKGKIDFYVYRTPANAESTLMPGGHKLVGSFYFQDTWKNDLPGKYNHRLTELTSQRHVISNEV